MMSRASARSIKDWHDRAHAATSPPHDSRTTEHRADNLLHKPATGRNSKPGRKAEKPRDPKAGGPSGQKDRARHDKRHANK